MRIDDKIMSNGVEKIEIKIEIKRKTFFIFLSGVLIIISGFFLIKTVNAALTCAVTATCNAPDAVVFRMSGATNAHAERPSQTTAAYNNNLVCCTETGIGNDCASSTKAVVLRLSGATNAHAEQSGQANANYNGNDVCLSVPSGNVSVAYRDTNCAAGEIIVASMSGATNAHVGDSAAYTTKICATTTPPAVISITLDQENFPYGSMANNTASSTLTLFGGNGIIATNGSAVADFYIYGANSSGTGGGWTLSAVDNSGNNYMHKFCDDTELACDLPANQANYIALTTSPALLEASVGIGGTVAFQLQILTPTTPTDFSTQSAVVTIQASAP